MTNMTAERATAKTAIAQGTAEFHGVRYLVSDLQRAIDFYTGHLGFGLEHQHLPEFATVALGPLKMHLSGPGASGSKLVASKAMLPYWPTVIPANPTRPWGIMPSAGDRFGKVGIAGSSSVASANSAAAAASR